MIDNRNYIVCSDGNEIAIERLALLNLLGTFYNAESAQNLINFHLSNQQNDKTHLLHMLDINTLVFQTCVRQVSFDMEIAHMAMSDVAKVSTSALISRDGFQIFVDTPASNVLGYLKMIGIAGGRATRWNFSQKQFSYVSDTYMYNSQAAFNKDGSFIGYAVKNYQAVDPRDDTYIHSESSHAVLKKLSVPHNAAEHPTILLLSGDNFAGV